MNSPRSIRLGDLISAVEAGATLLTSGSRLSAYLSDACARRRIDAGELAWESPDIRTWSGWLTETAETLRLRGLLDPEPCLSGLQERALWVEVIGEALGDASGLDDMDGTAARAQEARRLWIAWRARFDRNAAGLNPDCEAWLGWNRRYERRLNALGWSESACLPDELARLVESGDWVPDGALILTGFDELVPQQRELLDQMLAAGVTVEWRELEECPVGVVRRAFSDARQEANEVANWVRARLETRPDVRVGIVAPELNAVRTPLEFALQEALQPGATSPLKGSEERRFNISLGLPLAEQAIVRCALQLLRVHGPWIAFADLAQMLASPFLQGYESESLARARLDLNLRESGELELRLTRVAKRAEAHGCAMFARTITRLLEYQRTAGRLTPSGWADLFAEHLEALGWARGRPLSSPEYQAAEAFRETIPLLGTLDEIVGKMSRADAVTALARITREKLFQPKSQSSPVQVLGVLESVGMQFDHLWIMGLHDGVWPNAPKPNPFIPLPLQRDLSLPRSGPRRELDMAEIYTRRLLGSAADVVVSFPQMSGDEQLRCSPLIAGIPRADALEAADYSRAWIRSIHQSASLQSWLEPTGAPAPAGPVSGGSGLLKAQSACAFRAFVVHRLGARELSCPDIGLDAMQRGTLVHDVLQALWEAPGASDDLLQASGPGALQRIDAAISATLEKFGRQYPCSVTDGFSRVERNRLRELILRWIELEQQRAPFRVLGCEESQEVELEGLELSLQVDRIDELEDGQKLVIDYKTGRVRPAQWFGDRPEDPQLPLYSLAVEEPVAGLAFGILRAEKVEFQGVAVEPDLAPGLKAADGFKQSPGDWEATRAHWREVLERLARAYREGRADVDPLRYPQSCEYCPLNRYGVCRVREKLRTEIEEADDE